jgi:hypothetical protein
MTIPPLPPISLASIAGADRAASSKMAQASLTENAASNITSARAADKSVEGVEKDLASGDSEADGRQMLDTFERNSQDEDSDDQTRTPAAIANPKQERENTSHIDFTA